jgi:hypothetical protein
LKPTLGFISLVLLVDDGCDACCSFSEFLFEL